jgi:iron-sulfur cluster assembly protein
MIALTERAAERVKKVMSLRDGTLGIRAGVRGGGCSGFTYYLDFVSETDATDRELESYGVKIVVDRKSFLYLMGTEIDFVEELNDSGFKFRNPSAKRTCGCGESFSV